ncbi:MAG: hypothetical protein KDK36_04190 [Leptospiraceae bacterium]|nr:hypothetical protein [Leptospiraceae bacterium]
MRKIKAILFDSDGVITPKTPKIYFDLTHKLINKHTFLTKETLFQYFQSILSFSPWESINLFLKELGLMDLGPDLRTEFKLFFAENLKYQSLIDENFYPLIERLNLNKIDWKIVSLGSTEHFKNNPHIKF